MARRIGGRITKIAKRAINKKSTPLIDTPPKKKRINETLDIDIGKSIISINKARIKINEDLETVKFKDEIELGRQYMPEFTESLLGLMRDNKGLNETLNTILSAKDIRDIVPYVENYIKDSENKDKTKELELALSSKGNIPTERGLMILDINKEVFEHEKTRNPIRLIVDIRKKEDELVAIEIARIFDWNTPRYSDVEDYKEKYQGESGGIYNKKIAVAFNKVREQTPSNYMTDDLKELLEIQPTLEKMFGSLIKINMIYQSGTDLIFRMIRGLAKEVDEQRKALIKMELDSKTTKRDYETTKNKFDLLQADYVAAKEQLELIDKTLRRKREQISLIEGGQQIAVETTRQTEAPIQQPRRQRGAEIQGAEETEEETEAGAV
jgi:hypothetical protein